MTAEGMKLGWRLASMVIFIGAGASAYLYLLNRRLIQIRDARYKSVLIRFGGVLSVVGAGGLGYLAAGSAWLIVPAVILVAAALGEVRRWWERWRWRGAPPTVVENHIASLARPIVTTDLALARYELCVPAWPGPNLRIAHLSDFHVNSHLPLTYFEAAVRRVAAAEPDLIFYTGDFLTDPRHKHLLPGLLAQARGRLGTFGVLGNHDDWAGRYGVAEAVAAGGVTLLGNACVAVPAGNDAQVLVCGCEEPWTRTRWQAPAVAPDQLALMLTHTPDNIYRLSGHGLTAVFAGHYHAGQMRLPLLGALVVPSKYGRRFDHGHFVVRGTHLFVTAGVGSAEPPVRLWCQPDVFLVDVRGGMSDRADRVSQKAR